MNARLLVLKVLVCWIALGPGAALAQGDLEYAVKAAFLQRFGLYVDWPAAAFTAATSPFVLCVAGDDPFGESLDDAANGQRIHDRPVVVRRLKSITRDSGCHVAYLGGVNGQRLAQVVESLRGSPVLTVSDAARAAGAAVGIVHLVVRENRVRFEIDDAAAAENGLVISSKLLALALRVKQRAP